MSTAPDTRDERRRDDPPPRREKEPKQPPLSQREVFDLLLRDPAVRPYLYAALGALALIFLVMFDNNSDIGAVLVALLGLANLLFRWVSGPPFLLFVISWFALFPFGIPEAEFDNPFNIRENYFRIADLVLVLAVLVYMRSAFRIFGLIHAAMPLENSFKRPEDAPPRRPPTHVAPTELVWMIGTAVALVLLGQGAWWLVNNVEFRPADGTFPFRWADPEDSRRFLARRGPFVPGEFSAGQMRFFITLFALFFGFLLVRLVFGYWRLRSMSAAEAAAVCTDTAWAETHRERVRVEKWRLWRIQKALAEEREARRAEREAKKREEAKARAEERRKTRAAWEVEQRRERAERRRREGDEDEDNDRPRRRRRDEDDDDDDRPRRRR